MASWTAFGHFFAVAFTQYFWPSMVALALLAIVAWRVALRMRSAVPVLAGTVFLNKKPLPAFHLAASKSNWKAEDDFSNGAYVFYGPPEGDVKLVLTWGAGVDQSSIAVTVTLRKGVNVLDWTVPLVSQSVTVSRAGATPDTGRTVKVQMSAPTLSHGSAPSSFNLKYQLSASVVPASPLTSYLGGPFLSPLTFTQTALTQEYSFTLLAASSKTENWSVEIASAGATAIKHKATYVL